MVPFIKENIAELIKEKLLTISSATVNRLLEEPRKKNKLLMYFNDKSRERLKSTNTYKSIFRLGLIRIPGFFEIDTVSHDGGNASGEHIYSLTVTDVSVGWT